MIAPLRWLARMVVVALVLLGAPALAEEAAPVAAPASAQSGFEAANALYYQSDYEAAARGYARVLADHEVEDAVLYHNLGNAYFRTGAYGSAILYYRRGILLDPPESVLTSLERNLEVARRALQERYMAGGDGTQFIYGEPGGLLYRLTHLTSSTTLAVSTLVLWWLLFALLITWRLRFGRGGRGYGGAAIPVAVAAMLVGGLLWGRLATDEQYRLGVVVQDEITLREGPHPDARGVDLPEGMEVRIVDGEGDWTRVELANGREGWVEAEAIKQI